MTDAELQQRIGDEVQRRWNRRVLIGWAIYAVMLCVMAWGVFGCLQS